MSEFKFHALEAQLSAASPNVLANDRFLLIFDGIRERLDDAIDAVGIENVIAQAHAYYDKYVAPLDFPWVPDILEPTLIDMPAKQILAALIRAAHDKIHVD